MREKQSKKIAVLLLLVLAAAYSLLVFIWKHPSSFNLVQWTGYGFTLFAFVMAAVSFGIAGTGKRQLPFDSSYRMLTLLYLGIQFVVGGIFLVFGGIPLRLAFILQLIVAVAYLLIILLAKEVTVDGDAELLKRRDQTGQWRQWTATVRAIAEALREDEIRQQATLLIDFMEYDCNPIFPDSVLATQWEAKWKVTLNALYEAAVTQAQNQDMAKIRALLDDAKTRLVERNGLVRASY